MVPMMLLAALCTTAETENDLLAFGCGGLVFALGVFLRIWAQMHLHYRLKIRKTLTVTGPYALVRNPIYLGNTLILAGACMLAELFWLVPIQIAYCAVVYTFTVRYEEDHLTEKYGDAYKEYVSLVPRWFPKGTAGLSVAEGSFGRYLSASLLAEAHLLLLLVPFVVKELGIAWISHLHT